MLYINYVTLFNLQDSISQSEIVTSARHKSLLILSRETLLSLFWPGLLFQIELIDYFFQKCEKLIKSN